jgi:hypothetical protein
MLEPVKNTIAIEATAIGSAEALAAIAADAEAEAMIAEAEAEATPSTAEGEPEDFDVLDWDEPVSKPEDMSIAFIEDRINTLWEIGRANWSKEERREYRRLDQAMEAYESGETVEDVAKADARGSKSMGEDAITEANFRKFDSMKERLNLEYGEPDAFAKSLVRTANTEVRIQSGVGDATRYAVVVGDDYDGLRSGTHSYTWNQSEASLTIDYQIRRLLDQVLSLEQIRTLVIDGLNIRKGTIEFSIHHDADTSETKISNPSYFAKTGKGKGAVLGASKPNKWMPEGDISLDANFTYTGAHGTTIVPAGVWKTIASMFDCKRDTSKNFSEENLNRNGADWGALAKIHSSSEKTHTLHRKGYKNPKGASTGGRVIEALLEAMPVEDGKQLAKLLMVKYGALSFAEVSPAFRKLCGYDTEDGEETTGETATNNDVDGNE